MPIRRRSSTAVPTAPSSIWCRKNHPASHLRQNQRLDHRQAAEGRRREIIRRDVACNFSPRPEVTPGDHRARSSLPRIAPRSREALTLIPWHSSGTDSPDGRGRSCRGSAAAGIADSKKPAVARAAPTARRAGVGRQSARHPCSPCRRPPNEKKNGNGRGLVKFAGRANHGCRGLRHVQPRQQLGKTGLALHLFESFELGERNPEPGRKLFSRGGEQIGLLVHRKHHIDRTCFDDILYRGQIAVRIGPRRWRPMHADVGQRIRGRGGPSR